MSQLEDLTKDASARGLLPDGLAAAIDVKWIGTVAIERTYKETPRSPGEASFPTATASGDG